MTKKTKKFLRPPADTLTRYASSYRSLLNLFLYTGPFSTKKRPVPIFNLVCPCVDFSLDQETVIDEDISLNLDPDDDNEENSFNPDGARSGDVRGRIHTHMATVNVNLTLIFKPTHPPPLTSAHGRNIVPFLSIPEYNLQYFNNAFLL